MIDMILQGIDQIDSIDYLLKGKRLGLITNHSGLNKNFRSTIDILNQKYALAQLYAPEHGIRGNVQAGVKIENSFDKKTGIPVNSLFGEKTDLKNIECMVYDIQDLGLRFYTYIYALADAMKICGEKSVPFVVLDRYNPLGLLKVDGTVIEKQYNSFVGGYSLPSRYGLTVGEYAQYINAEYNFNCDLTVLKCSGLTRDITFRESGLSWVPPSPNCPTFETAECYVGTVVFEGTNVSQGRGTTKPFEMIGAPWMDGEKTSERMNSMNLPGVIFRSVYFTPTFSLYSGELCCGVQLHITDSNSFESFDCGIKLLIAIREDYPEFTFTSYGENNSKYYIDNLVGNNKIRLGTYTDADREKDRIKCEEFKKLTRKYMLYM